MTPPEDEETELEERPTAGGIAGRLLCRLGFHGYPRSQREVGYCPRGCGDLKRVHNAGAYWTRYVEPPSLDSRPPVGLPPRSIPTPRFRFSVARDDVLHTVRMLNEARVQRLAIRIEPKRAYFDVSQALHGVYPMLDSAGIRYRVSDDNHPTPVGR